jgi:hypothetical protein
MADCASLNVITFCAGFLGGSISEYDAGT